MPWESMMLASSRCRREVKLKSVNIAVPSFRMNLKVNYIKFGNTSPMDRYYYVSVSNRVVESTYRRPTSVKSDRRRIPSRKLVIGQE